jgi:deoxycytidylate deaminase/dephospho-CoA kinase
MSIPDALAHLFRRHSDFMVVGVTGRTGSGCTTAAQLLSREFSNLPLEAVASPLTTPEQRKYRIINEFSRKNWDAFIPISVTLVIVTFILEADAAALEQYLKQHLKERELAQLMTEVTRVRTAWDAVKQVVQPGRKKDPVETEAMKAFWVAELENLLLVLKKTLGPSSYASAFQMFGDNLRSSGNVLSGTFEAKAFFTLPTRVAEIVVAHRELQVSKGRVARIVIDAIRNPFEIEYFRQRFAPFLLIAVTTPDADRRTRLSVKLNLNTSEIRKLDAKEYPTENKPLAGSAQFVSQNIQACIEKADVFVRNHGAAVEGATPDLKSFTKQLVKFVSLMQHPGLVTPTKVERCMQIAYSAKANSGCISRQVGAAVADENFSIKAIGWNDVPAGQVPCLLRKAGDLVEAHDADAFSDYELQDERFQKHMHGRYKRFNLVLANGRSSAYCFKSEYNTLESIKMKGNQVHTRSLHAEENAFLQVSKYGGQGLEGGMLFSTASPCELCAKKAFQLGIKRVFYIDPYPGISMSHIIGSGAQKLRPSVELFYGAVGQAFHRLYDPILPYKDEVEVFMTLDESKGVAGQTEPAP